MEGKSNVEKNLDEFCAGNRVFVTCDVMRKARSTASCGKILRNREPTFS